MNEQTRVNEQSWANDEHWSGHSAIAIYFSKVDSRIWVPKRIPKYGWTLNFGHPNSAYWLLGIMIGLVLLPVVMISLLGG